MQYAVFNLVKTDKSTITFNPNETKCEIYPSSGGVALDCDADDLTAVLCLQDAIINARAVSEAEFFEHIKTDPKRARQIELAENAIKETLETVAKEKGYDSATNFATYAAYENPYQAEAQEFVAFRGKIWSSFYSIMPTSLLNDREALTAELEALVLV